MSAAGRQRVLVFLGTRPECIKLAPVVMALRARPEAFEVQVCLSSQHREMLRQALTWFPMAVDADLDVMSPGQHMVDVHARILERSKPLFDTFQPHLVIVQGDTATALAAAMAAFMHRVPVAHVEAGLRTYNRDAPWPEETNRILIGQLAEWHFAPTVANADALQREHVQGEVRVVGNTVIDALLQVRDAIAADAALAARVQAALARDRFDASAEAGPFVLVTGHRRESFGGGMQSICEALQALATRHPHMRFVYAVHLNPNVHDVVHAMLGDIDNVILLPPQDYGTFVYLMDRCTLLLSDSGGIQEEAPSLDKPVLVMRDTTERGEAVAAGAVRLVGTDRERIVAAVDELLTDSEAYRAMASASNPFGDGCAAEYIADALAGRA